MFEEHVVWVDQMLCFFINERLSQCWLFSDFFVWCYKFFLWSLLDYVVVSGSETKEVVMVSKLLD